MHFFANGTLLPPEEATSIGWYIRTLLIRLSALNRDDPCPGYFTFSGAETEIKLEVDLVRPSTPTAALCNRAIAILERLIETWGAEVIAFRFGQGIDLSKPQGQFRISLRQLPRDSGVDGVAQS